MRRLCGFLCGGLLEAAIGGFFVCSKLIALKCKNASKLFSSLETVTNLDPQVQCSSHPVAFVWWLLLDGTCGSNNFTSSGLWRLTVMLG